MCSETVSPLEEEEAMFTNSFTRNVNKLTRVNLHMVGQRRRLPELLRADCAFVGFISCLDGEKTRVSRDSSRSAVFRLTCVDLHVVG